jgi:aspartate aminotransferase
MPASDWVKNGMAESSWIRRMFEEGLVLKKEHGADKVFDLTLGNPIFEPPPEFKNELKRLAENPIPGMHRYMENAGYPETRAAIASQLTRESGVDYSQSDIVMTCGAAAALNVVLKTLLNHGDEVIIFAPYFAEYFHYIKNHYGVPRILPTDDKFLPDLNTLGKTIGPRTRAVIINSPNNPSGVVYQDAFLKSLGEVLSKVSAKHGNAIYLLSDEPYKRLIYDNASFAYASRRYSNTIIVNSHSKDLALPGERIGYIAIHPECNDRIELLDGFIYCNRTLGFVNAPAFMQHAVRNIQHISVSVAAYQRKRDMLYEALSEMGYSMLKPQGAFYMFPKSPIPDDIAFIRELQKELVLTVPGQGFGTPGYFRISYCLDDKTIKGSFGGFRKVARRHGLGRGS